MSEPITRAEFRDFLIHKERVDLLHPGTSPALIFDSWCEQHRTESASPPRVPGASAQDEFAWVIERGDSQPSAPTYWSGHDDRWSQDHMDAVRFSRKQDAERVACNLHSGYHRVCEHGWIGAPMQRQPVGVQSGPGQPIDICERMNHARDCVPGAELRMLLAEGEMEIRRLRGIVDECQEAAGIPADQAEDYCTVSSLIADKVVELEDRARTERRAGIEAAAQYCIEGDVLLPDQAKAMVRALADKPPADEMELRPEVAAFARLMERELRTNDARRGAAGWKGMTAAELLRMLDADAAKLRFALGAGDATKAIEQCADVANMAMMIADVTEIAARKGG